MRIFSINRGVKGSRTLQEHAIRFAYMITEVAKKRAKIISFWKKYGFPAVEEAYSVKRRTLFGWQKKLREGKGKLESLNCGSRSPKNKRRRRYDWRIIEEIKHLRLLYPNLGEKKIHSLLLEFCAPPSISGVPSRLPLAVSSKTRVVCVQLLCAPTAGARYSR